MQRLIIILVLLAFHLTGNASTGRGYAEGYFRLKIARSEIVFIGSLSEVKKTHMFEGKEVSEEEATIQFQSYIENLGDAEREEFKRPETHYTARLIREKALKGPIETPDSIELSWSESFGTLCHHRLTETIGKTGIYWLPAEADEDIPFVPIDAAFTERIETALKATATTRLEEAQ